MIATHPRSMLKILLLVISWAAFSAGSFEEGSSATPAARVRIAGFWPDYRPLEHLNHSAPLLSDLILFSLELNEDGNVGNTDGAPSCCLRPEHYERARTVKEMFAPNLNLWVSIGGAGRTHHWEQVCSDPTKRARFIESVENLWYVLLMLVWLLLLLLLL
jgi:Glycosyl hydrolases family 18